MSKLKTLARKCDRQNEMFRTTLGLLLTAPKDLEVSYIYAGVGNVEGSACDIIEAQTGGSSYKLYLDQSTHLPRMISYQGMKPIVVKFNKDEAGNVGENKLKFLFAAEISRKAKPLNSRQNFPIFVPSAASNCLINGRKPQADNRNKMLTS